MPECKPVKRFKTCNYNTLPVEKNEIFSLTNHFESGKYKNYEIADGKASYHRLQLITL